MEDQKQELKEALSTPLVDLLKKVIFEDYTIGVDDEVLINRVKKVATIEQLEKQINELEIKIEENCKWKIKDHKH
jgi:hypothetical protein